METIQKFLAYEQIVCFVLLLLYYVYFRFSCYKTSKLFEISFELKDCNLFAFDQKLIEQGYTKTNPIDKHRCYYKSVNIFEVSFCLQKDSPKLTCISIVGSLDNVLSSLNLKTLTTSVVTIDDFTIDIEVDTDWDESDNEIDTVFVSLVDLSSEDISRFLNLELDTFIKKVFTV